MSSKLILLPNVLNETFSKEDLPGILQNICLNLSGVIVESEKPGRRFFLHYLSRDAYQNLKQRVLNEHTKKIEIKRLAEEIHKSQQTWGLVTDGGLSCIADPGSQLVFLLHQLNVPIKAISGPSSIFLSLMLSGFSGQKFAFHGYLPRENKELTQKLKSIESFARKEKQTQIWIETPYRNEKMISSCLNCLHAETFFCVVMQIDCPDQKICVKKISEWKSMNLKSFKKNPAVFLLAASIS